MKIGIYKKDEDILKERYEDDLPDFFRLIYTVESKDLWRTKAIKSFFEEFKEKAPIGDLWLGLNNWMGCDKDIDAIDESVNGPEDNSLIRTGIKSCKSWKEFSLLHDPIDKIEGTDFTIFPEHGMQIWKYRTYLFMSRLKQIGYNVEVVFIDGGCGIISRFLKGMQDNRKELLKSPKLRNKIIPYINVTISDFYKNGNMVIGLIKIIKNIIQDVYIKPVLEIFPNCSVGMYNDYQLEDGVGAEFPLFYGQDFWRKQNIDYIDAQLNKVEECFLMNRRVVPFITLRSFLSNSMEIKTKEYWDMLPRIMMTPEEYRKLFFGLFKEKQLDKAILWFNPAPAEPPRFPEEMHTVEKVKESINLLKEIEEQL